MAICKVSIAVVFVAWLATVHCHTYYLGSCPRVEPMNDFDMEKVHLKRVVNLQIKRNNMLSRCNAVSRTLVRHSKIFHGFLLLDV